MPAGMGEEERFANAVENGTTPASFGRGEDTMVRELEIVGMLRSGAPAYGPDPAARGRAKQLFMAAAARQFGQDVDAALEYAAVDRTAEYTTVGYGDDTSTPTAPLQVIAPVAPAGTERVCRTRAERLTTARIGLGRPGVGLPP